MLKKRASGVERFCEESLKKLSELPIGTPLCGVLCHGDE